MKAEEIVLEVEDVRQRWVSPFLTKVALVRRALRGG